MSSKSLFSLLPCLRTEERDTGIVSSSIFLENGSKLLEDLIASCDGKSNPIRCYSLDELTRATNNFDPSCIIQDFSAEFRYQMFNGFLDDRSITIKKFMSTAQVGYEARSLAIRDIIITMQMSSHNNVLKLLGCCLELPIPALVLECASEGVLTSEAGCGANQSLPWNIRPRIAKQLANAITYLHTAFSRPIIHRDIRASCVFLGNDYIPKLCNFSLSITIPPMQSHVVDEPKGTYGYLDPAYMRSGYISEKTDVYSFGVLLLILLTGQKVVLQYQGEFESIISYVKRHASDGQIQTVVDPKILGEIGEDKQAQEHLHLFLALALSCTQDESEVRPDMIDVAKELILTEKSVLLR
ncbi:serine/threonine-protein kinase ZRK1-like [Rosa rugosa]|uniref:serine/threonine-protein kinase ZRK1-like n=1 Tax=Rosa rugosa TaxID=74645 RepID=UPI002B4101F7|nr:serine/threonine-protein kinase ZRK1-like [Rosa rugosa]